MNNLNLGEIKKIVIDNTDWKVNKQFKGFKQVPVGVHLLSLDDDINNFIFVYVRKDKMVLIDFDTKTRSLNLVNEKDSLYAIYSNSIDGGEIQAYLAGYRIENYEIWKLSTLYITDRTLKRVFSNKKEPKFPVIDIKGKDKVKAMEKSAVICLFMDRTPQLLELINYEIEDRYKFDLIGLLQLSYVCFISLENLESWQFFQSLSYLFCESESILIKDTHFSMEFLKAFCVILKQFPNDFFYDDITRENYLNTSIRHLMDNLSDKEQYREIFIFFNKILKKYFNFEWRDILTDSKESGLFINELIQDDEKPSLVAENEEFISF